MLAHTFDHCRDAGVTNTESRSRTARNISFPAGSTVECHITYNNILFRVIGSILRSGNNELSTGKAFSIGSVPLPATGNSCC